MLAIREIFRETWKSKQDGRTIIWDFHRILSQKMGYPRKFCSHNLHMTLEILKSLEICFRKSWDNPTKYLRKSKEGLGITQDIPIDFCKGITCNLFYLWLWLPWSLDQKSVIQIMLNLKHHDSYWYVIYLYIEDETSILIMWGCIQHVQCWWVKHCHFKTVGNLSFMTSIKYEKSGSTYKLPIR